MFIVLWAIGTIFLMINAILGLGLLISSIAFLSLSYGLLVKREIFSVMIFLKDKIE